MKELVENSKMKLLIYRVNITSFSIIKIVSEDIFLLFHHCDIFFVANDYVILIRCPHQVSLFSPLAKFDG